MNKLIVVLAVMAGGYYYWSNNFSKSGGGVFSEELTPQECSAIGGKYTEFGCVQSISEDACAEMGGSLDDDGACIILPTESQCNKMGGRFSADGSCIMAQWNH